MPLLTPSDFDWHCSSFQYEKRTVSNLGLQIQSEGKYIQFLNVLEENHFFETQNC